MKNGRQIRSNFLPKNDRLRREHLPAQRSVLAEASARGYDTALLASGYTGLIFVAKNSGIECTCAKTTSLLTEDGGLKPTSIDRITQNLYNSPERITFHATDIEPAKLDPEEWDEEPLDGEVDLTTYTGFFQTRCGCCYGTGFVGGFDLIDGYHNCFQTPLETDFTAQLSVNPNRYSGGTYATFLICIPVINRETHVFGLRLWNKDETIDPKHFSYNDLKGGFEEILEIKTQHDFTHVEIQITPITASPINFPQVPEEFLLDARGDKQNTTFYLPSGVALTRFSLIREFRYNRVWQVVQVIPHYDTIDNRKHLIYQSAECRLAMQEELINSIPRQ